MTGTQAYVTSETPKHAADRAVAGGAARVCLGVISGPHGVRGEVKIRSFTERPDDVAAYGALEDESGQRSFSLTVRGRGGASVIARLVGIDDREAAQALAGTRLFVAREALPRPAAEEYYHVDLVGLRAERHDGQSLGRVSAIHNFGAGDVLEIAGQAGDAIDEGETVMVPFTLEAVPAIDLEGGRVVVAPPPGLITEVPE